MQHRLYLIHMTLLLCSLVTAMTWATHCSTTWLCCRDLMNNGLQQLPLLRKRYTHRASRTALTSLKMSVCLQKVRGVYLYSFHFFSSLYWLGRSSVGDTKLWFQSGDGIHVVPELYSVGSIICYLFIQKNAVVVYRGKTTKYMEFAYMIASETALLLFIGSVWLLIEVGE